MKKAIAGKEYLCIETVVMDNGKTLYIQGKKYKSEKEGCITNEENNPDHTWTKKGMKPFFRLACGIETEPEFVITKGQIKALREEINVSQQSAVMWLEDKFPDVLKEDKLELYVGKWYKYPDYPKWKFCITEIDYKSKLVKGFGFGSDGNWMQKEPDHTWDFEELEKVVEVPQQEVFEALKAEAVKRYKNNDAIKCLANGFLDKIDTVNLEDPNDCFQNRNEFWIPINAGNQNACVFKDGNWAEIIPTITKEDAEKELGKKILN